MIWIITAMQQEADFIVNFYKLEKVKSYKNISIYKNDNIILVLTWIWKIQASIWTTLLVNNFNVKYIINIWIAWNTWLEKSSKIWDIFLINKIYQHDIFMPFEWEHLNYFKKPISLQSNININKSNFNFNIFENWVCATWDQFIQDKKIIEEIKNKTEANVVEMEAFAVASSVREFDMLDKLVIIKAVSDNADENADNDSENNIEIAMKNSILALNKIVNEIL